MEKVNSSVCIRCGGPLPAGRKAWCCTCRPLRRRAELRKPPKKEPPKYTLAEWQAMAEAYDMSYGQYHLYVSMGWMLPPKKHPIKWPEGRKYAKKAK